MNNYINHFKTVCKHKYYVAKELFKFGYYWQGITHDLSKFSPVEFFASARYFSGTVSPIEKEKSVHGYSLAWLNHKGKINIIGNIGLIIMMENLFFVIFLINILWKWQQTLLELLRLI